MELKSPKTYDEQIEILRRKGLLIVDEDFALRTLSNMNYYRFTGYVFHYKEKGELAPGVCFEDIISIYRFDSALRSIILTYLEPTEVFLRSIIAYEFAHSYGSGGHYIAANFLSGKYHEEFLARLELERIKNAKTRFVRHHIDKYGGRMPIWVAVEIMPMGMLSLFYKNLEEGLKTRIARRAYVKADFLVNWMHCLSVLRNTCAHYGRLYNNEQLFPGIRVGKSMLRSIPDDVKNTQVYLFIYAMFKLLPNSEDRDAFIEQLQTLFQGRPNCVDIRRLGFPDDWNTILLNLI